MRFGQKYCPERKAKREIREIYKKQKKVYQRINERNNKREVYYQTKGSLDLIKRNFIVNTQGEE